MNENKVAAAQARHILEIGMDPAIRKRMLSAITVQFAVMNTHLRKAYRTAATRAVVMIDSTPSKKFGNNRCFHLARKVGGISGLPWREGAGYKCS